MVCILLRKRPIGGWLLYFFFQVLIGLGLVFTTTHWKRYLSTAWGNPLIYFLFTLSNLSRILILMAIAAIVLTLFITRQWQWVGGLQLALVAQAVTTVLKLQVDLIYFRESTFADLIGLAFPAVWIVYFSVSRRVHLVFHR